MSARRRVIVGSVIVTVLIELVCVVLRFNFGLTSTEQTRSTIGVLTFGLRIHHGYVGIGMMLIWPLISHRVSTKLKAWYWITANSLVASDLIHHFLVLWPLEGDPHFDIFY